MAGRTTGHRPKACEVYKRQNEVRTTLIDPMHATNSTCFTAMQKQKQTDGSQRVIYQNTDGVLLGEMFNGRTKKEQEELQKRKKQEQEEQRQLRAAEKEKKLKELENLRAMERRAPVDTGVLKADVALEIGEKEPEEEEDIPDDWDA
eukprot:TRINITY_DN6006_c0_g1_i1.p1 TRINITY_DN6006_c0_g1~~TRINITY_DN6006_c0_g1_i1.p1  ORF type:complete len:167 (+),score=46.40 TRINITY_DN6006_c0_g1_i1:62-502(+)